MNQYSVARRLAPCALLICLAGCGGSVLNPSGQSITYHVTGSGTSSASLTYSGVGGSTQQLSNAALPWTLKYSGGDFKRDDFLYISAQNNAAAGCVTAEILRGTTVFKTATSCGGFVIATASGSNN